MGSYQKQSACLVGLPTEIQLDIYSNLDVSSVFALSETNRSLNLLFQEQRAAILIPVLAQEFSPFDELLQIYTASAKDIEDGEGHYQQRNIVFKRFAGSKGYSFEPNSGFVPDLANYSQAKPSSSMLRTNHRPLPSNFVLGEKDLRPLIQLCLLVRKWEGLFPQMRWFHEAENCRLLQLHEAHRFRRAFYRWWLYGIYFHGEMPRPRIALPEPCVNDIRISQLRYHSTTELLELMDLLETTKDVILHYICPRLDPDYLEPESTLDLSTDLDRVQSMSTGWTNQSRWGRIVKTYAKLGPRELMHYFENVYSYSRQRLIHDIQLQCPSFTFDQESIQVAIRCVLSERDLEHRLPSLAQESVGGILDFGDERDEERMKFGNDGSADGSLPVGCKAIRSYSRYSPRGDDGSLLEDARYGGSLRPRSIETSVRA